MTQWKLLLIYAESAYFELSGVSIVEVYVEGDQSSFLLGKKIRLEQPFIPGLNDFISTVADEPEDFSNWLVPGRAVLTKYAGSTAVLFFPNWDTGDLWEQEPENSYLMLAEEKPSDHCEIYQVFLQAGSATVYFRNCTKPLAAGNHIAFSGMTTVPVLNNQTRTLATGALGDFTGSTKFAVLISPTVAYVWDPGIVSTTGLPQPETGTIAVTEPEPSKRPCQVTRVQLDNDHDEQGTYVEFEIAGLKCSVSAGDNIAFQIPEMPQLDGKRFVITDDPELEDVDGYLTLGQSGTNILLNGFVAGTLMASPGDSQTIWPESGFMFNLGGLIVNDISTRQWHLNDAIPFGQPNSILWHGIVWIRQAELPQGGTAIFKDRTGRVIWKVTGTNPGHRSGDIGWTNGFVFDTGTEAIVAIR